MSTRMPSQVENRVDIATPEDIEAFVREFYSYVAQDDVLGPMFNEVAQVDWAAHIPKLAAFWNRAVFGMQGYSGNPFEQHRRIHEQRHFTEAMFLRWLQLFEETLDRSWSGENVDRMRSLARNVARVHSERLVGSPVHWPGGSEIG